MGAICIYGITIILWSSGMVKSWWQADKCSFHPFFCAWWFTKLRKEALHPTMHNAHQCSMLFSLLYLGIQEAICCQQAVQADAPLWIVGCCLAEFKFFEEMCLSKKKVGWILIPNWHEDRSLIWTHRSIMWLWSSSWCFFVQFIIPNQNSRVGVDVEHCDPFWRLRLCYQEHGIRWYHITGWKLFTSQRLWNQFGMD